MTDLGISNGRKEIVAYCHEVFGITSWQTVRAWIKLFSFPVRHLPNGKPFLIHSEAFDWAIKYDNIKRTKKTGIPLSYPRHN